MIQKLKHTNFRQKWKWKEQSRLKRKFNLCFRRRSLEQNLAPLPAVHSNSTEKITVSVKSLPRVVPSKHLFWWRRLEDVLKTYFVFVFRGRLDQDKHIRLSHTLSEDIFKKSSRRLGQDQCIRLGHTSSRRLQDIFKTSCQTSSIRLQEVLQKCLQDIFKTSSRRFEDVLKTSWKDMFKTF